MLNLNRHYVQCKHQTRNIKLRCRPRAGGEGVLLGILGGVCRPVLQILTLFQTQNMSFSTPVFRPDF